LLCALIKYNVLGEYSSRLSKMIEGTINPSPPKFISTDIKYGLILSIFGANPASLAFPIALGQPFVQWRSVASRLKKSNALRRWLSPLCGRFPSAPARLVWPLAPDRLSCRPSATA
jgi:hypothetical protein